MVRIEEVEEEEKPTPTTTTTTTTTAPPLNHEEDRSDDEAAVFVDAPSEPDVAALKAEALDLKEKGNAFFLAGDMDGALSCYDAAAPVAAASGDVALEVMLHSNRAAVMARLGDWPGCLAAADAALALDPACLKAHLRRGRALEETGKLEDAAGAFEKGGDAARAKLLQAKAKEKQDKEMAEMMEKLKGLGNTLLGKIGLSLDNFVTEKREDGTMNIQFKQN
jgi:tetratricopeptide (TPR) repeat protein